MTTAGAAIQLALSLLLLAALRGWSAREMRPFLLGWAQVPTQALEWFLGFAVALVQVRQELAGFRLLLAMSR